MTAPPWWLLPVLIPLAVLYAGVTAVHRALYRLRVLKTRSLPRPVVSVGNLTAGGGGKTPVVMWLVEALVKEGLKPAVLSRGYGREGDGTRIVDPDGPWRIFGDEPYMMARKLEDIPVVVAANRYQAGLELLRHRDVDLFILDDGFQHHALGRDLDIVTIDGRRRFGNGRLVPAGILRDPVKRLRDADYVVVTKSFEHDPDFEEYLSRWYPGPVLWAEYRSHSLELISGTPSEEENTHPEGPFMAFCGIADPESFRASLKRMGLMIQDLMAFPDHHPYTFKDIARITGSARTAGATALLTTEKDAVRLPNEGTGIPCYAPVMETVMPDDSYLLIELIADVVSSKGTRA